MGCLRSNLKQIIAGSIGMLVVILIFNVLFKLYILFWKLIAYIGGMLI